MVRSMNKKYPLILWFRQDLRLEDNLALNAAVKDSKPIIPVYIKDEGEFIGGAASWWLHHSLNALKEQLKTLNLNLLVREGNCLKILQQLISETSADTVYWNRCYEPASIRRDGAIKAELKSQSINATSFKGNLLFEPWEIENKQKKPFQVFTPFWKCCLTREIPKPSTHLNQPILSFDVKNNQSIDSLNLLPKIDWDKGFKTVWKPGSIHAKEILNQFIQKDILNYEAERDRPDIDSVSHLSAALHFGEITPAMIYHTVIKKYGDNTSEVAPYLRQLFWREFAHHLIYHFPKTENLALRKEFDHFPWINDPDRLKAWKKGLTGYPLVDAGMRQLWTIGWMHNRVRMVVGSFLVKDLLIKWQEGAKWFMDTLVDADLANNTLGWQWVAGCGADAAPYFRIFNPTTQSEKFDPEGEYIRKWVPELKHLDKKWIHKPFSAPAEVLRNAGITLGKTYPNPIIDHDEARKIALNALKNMKDE